MMKKIKNGIFFILGMFYMWGIIYWINNSNSMFNNQINITALDIMSFIDVFLMSMLIVLVILDFFITHWRDD